jgi:hypothetical protein
MKLYYGVVENNADPEKLGRVQVRIVGKHTDNRTDSTAQDYMPVTDLPWAQTLQNGTVMSNESSMFTIPKNGSVVVLSFIDEDEQFPIILGSVPKIPDTLPDFTKGFSDPNQVNPTAASLGVSPVSNYATGTPQPDAVTLKLLDTEVAVPCVDQVWSEPPTVFAPEFPNNMVVQSGQNVLELDDTPLKERVNLQHSSGTFTEVHNSGLRVKKIKGKEFIIVDSDQNILVKGKSNLTVVGGLNMDSTTTIKVKAGGDVSIVATTGTINITGLLQVNASLISLN